LPRRAKGSAAWVTPFALGASGLPVNTRAVPMCALLLPGRVQPNTGELEVVADGLEPESLQVVDRNPLSVPEV